MIVISDSSPLILFSKIGHLHLLSQLFENIVIPPAVYNEVVAHGRDRSGSVETANAPWIIVRSVTNESAFTGLSQSLGPGEREVLALATEIPLPYLLIVDDAAGRRVAIRRRMPLTGSAGILVAAKMANLIPTVRPMLDELLSAGLHLDEQAYSRTLINAGETR